MTNDVLLVVGGDVVTMDAERRVVTGASVAVAGGRIADIGTAERLRAAFPGAAELDARGCVVTPGLVNAHQHATADPLIRSMIPDDISSDDAIYRWIVPLHELVDGDDDELAATLLAVESVRTGVTTVLDPGTVAYPLRVAAGFRAVGVRGRVGRWGWDADGAPYAAPPAETLAAQEESIRAVGTEGLVSGWVTLVGHSLVSDELFVGAAELAARLDVGATWHISPGEDDVRAYAERSGLRPLVHLDRLGVLSPRVLLGHAVWLDDAELEVALATGVGVASCPAAYARLGQGYGRAGRHGELAARGGRVAIGGDSHNAGDRPDVLGAARVLAAFECDRGTVLRADQAFALATVDGARAVGLGDVVGSIEVGKAADLAVFDTADISWTPRGDLALHLLWAAPTHTVRDVLVAGRVVLRDRQVVGVDEAALRAEAADRSAHLLRRAGVEVPSRWRYVDPE